MKSRITLLLCLISLVCFCCLSPFVQAGDKDVLVGFGTVGDTQAVRVVNINQMKTNSFANLWCQYRVNRDWVVLRIMIGRSSCEITEQTDQEICDLFNSAPTGQLALLLGMCSSGHSRDLLKQYAETTDTELAEACRLGLARRGDKAAEAFFIEKYVEQSGGQAKGTDRNQTDALIESIFRLEYIGSVDAILTVFDSVRLDAISSADSVTVKRDTAANMRAFLAQVGAPVPPASSEKELKQWWDENRDAVGKILRDKKDLPRMKMSRVIKSSR